MRTEPIAAVLVRRPGVLEAALFTDRERADCAARRRPAQHYAARLAAKLAVRALFPAVSLQAIEVVKDAAGAPSIDESPLMTHLSGSRLLLSLSHEGGLAVALVVAEG